MDITPGTTHFTKLGESLCCVELTSDWEEDEDAEFIYSRNIDDVDCKNCLEQLK